MLINESTRSKTFDYSVFKSLKSLPGKIKYAKDNLELLSNEGTSRIVFLLSSKKVLKLCQLSLKEPKVKERGIAQNKAEVKNSQEISSLVTKVFDYASDFTWIVSEIARPLTSEKEFYNLAGFPLKILRMFLIEGSEDNFNIDLYAKRFPKSIKIDLARIKKWEGFSDLLKTMKDPLEGLHPGDFGVVDHWGKTAEGRIVLLDSGATWEVIFDLYSLHEDIFAVLKNKQVLDPYMNATQKRQLGISQGIISTLENLYNSLEQSRMYFEIISSINNEVKGSNEKLFQEDAAIEFGNKLESIVQRALSEYQEHVNEKLINNETNNQSFQLKENLTITVPTLATFIFSAVSNLSSKLIALESIAKKYNAVGLLNGLRISGMIVSKLEKKGIKFAQPLNDEMSLRLYQTLWNFGFQPSKTFLISSDYLQNKENAKTLCEGLFYKLNLAYYTIPAIQSLLSIAVAYLKEDEMDVQSIDWYDSIFKNITNYSKDLKWTQLK